MKKILESLLLRLLRRKINTKNDLKHLFDCKERISIHILVIKMQ